MYRVKSEANYGKSRQLLRRDESFLRHGGGVEVGGYLERSGDMSIDLGVRRAFSGLSVINFSRPRPGLVSCMSCVDDVGVEDYANLVMLLTSSSEKVPLSKVPRCTTVHTLSPR